MRRGLIIIKFLPKAKQKMIFIYSHNNKDQYYQNNIYSNKTQIEIKNNLNLTHDNIYTKIVN